MINWLFIVIIHLVQAQTWHRKGLGISRVARFVPGSNASVLLTNDQVARLDEQGSIEWRQPVTASKLEVGEKVFLLEQNLLMAFDLANGAKEWVFPSVDSFAPHSDGVVVVSANQWAFINSQNLKAEWKPLQRGQKVVHCEGSAYLESGSKLETLKGEPAQACTPRVPKVDISNNEIKFEGLWSLHEGLSYIEAACFVTELNSETHVETWKKRMSRHARMITKQAEDPKVLLVAATSDKSLYALDAETGDIEWVRHNAFEGTPSLHSDKDLFVIKTAERRYVYNFMGELVTSLNSDRGFHYKSSGSKVTGYNGTTQTWVFELPGATEISLVQRPPTQSASLAAHVNRQDFLYKYLNPNLVLASGFNTTHTMVYLLDGISGREIYHTVHEATYAARETAAIASIGEHGIAYALGNDVYVWKLYETKVLNARRSSAKISALDDYLVPYVATTHYKYDAPITKLTMSQTLFGVTAQTLVWSNLHDQIVAVPLSHMRNGTLAPESILSRNDAVRGVEVVITHPSQYESTFYVAGVGKDIFVTKHSPSGTFDHLTPDFPFSGVIISLLIASYAAYQLVVASMHYKLQVAWA